MKNFKKIKKKRKKFNRPHSRVVALPISFFWHVLFKKDESKTETIQNPPWPSNLETHFLPSHVSQSKNPHLLTA
ncbi:hypothetical protein PRUPE_6G157100 [Prunus persica]|uniref:Uncharacterized protein n=1 Tax=Prunus persica TaxID=3760 RepID=A0A251NR44_PRUPE|nr:hypothetical protein PRUPE_6G157100 [Prunus persica]